MSDQTLVTLYLKTVEDLLDMVMAEHTATRQIVNPLLDLIEVMGAGEHAQLIRRELAEGEALLDARIEELRETVRVMAR